MFKCWLSLFYSGSLLAFWLASTSFCSSSEKDEDRIHGSVFEYENSEATRVYYVDQTVGREYGQNLTEYREREEVGLVF